MNRTHKTFRSWAASMLSERYRARHGTDVAREVFQTSTMAALLDGIYDGEVTISQLLTHGDFGLGTFNHLDGEMVVLDHVCYHLRSDGSASIAADHDLTPFAAVTWFAAETKISVSSPISRTDLTAKLDSQVDSTNLIHPIRIAGRFRRVQTRTVKAQTVPYPPLTEATAGQAITEFTDVDGTLAGFRTPDYEQGISVAGYHLHFLDQSRSQGGHALDFEFSEGEIAISTATQLHLSLPTTQAFLTAHLSLDDVAAQIHQAEGD